MVEAITEKEAIDKVKKHHFVLLEEKHLEFAKQIASLCDGVFRVSKAVVLR